MVQLNSSPDQEFLCRLEGHVAQRAGLCRRECPYPTGTHSARLWLEGWRYTADDQTFFDGVDAARTRVQTLAANPFARGTAEYDDWQEGFLEGVKAMGWRVRGFLYAIPGGRV